MATVTSNVTIKSITSFERVNIHARKPFTERFVAITMVAPDGGVYVTFTRESAYFAVCTSDKVGQEVLISGKVKRDQDYNAMGGQTVLTNCVVGVYSYQAQQQKRKAKAMARLF